MRPFQTTHYFVRVGDLVVADDVVFVCTRMGRGGDLYGVMLRGWSNRDPASVNEADESLVIDGMCWMGPVEIIRRDVPVVRGAVQ